MTEQITNNNLENTPNLLLISANYNNQQKAVVLKFYDPISHKDRKSTRLNSSHW